MDVAEPAVVSKALAVAVGIVATRAVPAALPSDAQGCVPPPSSAPNSSRPPSATTAPAGAVPPTLLPPGRMSATSRVPAAVPSVIQGSRPCTPSSAAKPSVPPRAASAIGAPSAAPGLMSFTSCVPAGVPSVLHSSRPRAAFEAAKKARLPTITAREGSEPPVAAMSASGRVPAVVPSENQGSCPLEPSSPLKTTPPAKGTMS